MRIFFLTLLLLVVGNGCRSLEFERYDPNTGAVTYAKWKSGMFKTKGLDVKVGDTLEIKSENTSGGAGEVFVTLGKMCDTLTEALKKAP